MIPELRGIALHALPNVIEGKLIPVALFVAFLELLGNMWALLITLAWTLGAIAFRAATGRQVPGLLVLSAIAVSARTIAGLATGSMVVYFLQPTITTVLVGLAFMISAPLGIPLAQRLAYDVIPFDDATKQHPLVRSFFMRMSIVWALTSLANGAITLWLLLSSSTTTFVLVKSALGPGSSAAAIVIMLIWLRWSSIRTGTTIVRARSKCGAARVAEIGENA